MRKCCQSPRHLVEILLVLVAHVDLFEQSSSPPERNMKWPKTEHKTAKNGWKLSKVAITGSTRPLLAKYYYQMLSYHHVGVKSNYDYQITTCR